MASGFINGESELEQFETAKTQPGVAAWNDYSRASTLASQSLREAAGITVPKREFVLWMVGIYLLLVVPLNWLIFRLAGRVEWAWAAVPFLAIGWAAMVIWFAQLDIGFARAETEIAVLEAQNGFSRAHLTRYTALYTSLSTSYNVRFDDQNAVAQPFNVDVRLLRGQAHSTVVLRRDGEPFLSDFTVSSNSTGMVHSEEMLDLGGPLAWHNDEKGWYHESVDRHSRELPPSGGTLENKTKLPISGAAIVRKSAAGVEWAWLGELAQGKRVEVAFEPFDREAREMARDESPLTRTQLPEGGLSLRRLLDFAEDPRLLEPGEIRLVGWRDDAPAGVRVAPAAAQARARRWLWRTSKCRKSSLGPTGTCTVARFRPTCSSRPNAPRKARRQSNQKRRPPMRRRRSKTPRKRLRRSHDRTDRFRQTLRRLHGRRIARLEDRGGRVVRLHRAQRRRQEHHDPLPGHAVEGHRTARGSSTATASPRIRWRCARASATCPTTSACTTA